MSEKELERTCRDGEVIVREGERSREMFVIQSGSVRITKRVGASDVELAVLAKGDFFGEMSVLESLPRDASAVAVGETKLLSISTGALLVRMRRDPTFAYELLHRLSGRIRALNARLVATMQSRGAGQDADGDRRTVMLYIPDGEGAEDESVTGEGDASP